VNTSAADKTQVADPLIGMMLGEYRVLEPMARGSTAVVYRGEHPTIGKKVAVKVLLPELAENDEVVGRLLEEARSVNAIRHPNLISIYGFGQLPDGRHYYVMEFLVGETLAHLLGQRKRLELSEVVTILEQMCDGLTAAHDAGVVHRNLEPGNVFLCEFPDGTRRVKLLDFGIAKRLDSSVRTVTNVRLGTPAYMAPEQIRGQAVTKQTDLYALGVMTHFMLAGSEPFRDVNPVNVMDAHLNREPPPLRDRVENLAPEMDALVTALLQKEASGRPWNAGEVKVRLQRVKATMPRATTLELPRLSMLTPKVPQVPAGSAVEESATLKPGAEPAPDTLRNRPPVVKPLRLRRRSLTPLVLLIGGVAAGIGGTVLVMRPARTPVAPVDVPAERLPAPIAAEPSPPRVEPAPVAEEPAAPPEPAAPEPAAAPEHVAPEPNAPAAVKPPSALALVHKPPAPRPQKSQKSRDEVRAQLAGLGRSSQSLPSDAVRKLVEQELSRLRTRLEAGEKPAQISAEADQLARESGL
jgi:serine/threonine-protein kinase